jgi:hypothetical protein
MINFNEDRLKKVIKVKKDFEICKNGCGSDNSIGGLKVSNSPKELVMEK